MNEAPGLATAWAETELGRFFLGATDGGLALLCLDEQRVDQRLQAWARRPESRAEVTERAREWAVQAARELDEYARGERSSFDVPLDLVGTEFQRAVWEAERTIPFGSTRTYAQIAKAAGRPQAVRAVGQATGANPIPIVVPCHRVLARQGLGGFTGGLATKRRLLRHEGALLFD